MVLGVPSVAPGLLVHSNSTWLTGTGHMALFPAIPADSAISSVSGSFSIVRVCKALLGVDMVLVKKAELLHLPPEHCNLVFLQLKLFLGGLCVHTLSSTEKRRVRVMDIFVDTHAVFTIAGKRHLLPYPM